MARQFAWVLLAAFAAAPALSAQTVQQPPPGGKEQKQNRETRPQDPNRFKWWIDADSRRELGITDAQSSQIDQIFEGTMPAQRAKWREVQQLEDALSKLLKEHVADVAYVTQQVERVEKLEAELRITRTVMLYRMNLVLTAEQRVKLEALRKRRDENRRKSEHR
jgi:Spy/CpxP family protein refolding chaperone